MTAYVYVQNSHKYRRVLCNDTVTIGRGQTNDIVVNNPRVSRNHAIIRRVGKIEYHLIDCDSSNGTFLDNHRIEKPTPLFNGCKISIGTTTMTFAQGNAEYLDETDLEKLDDTLSPTMIQPSAEID